MRQTQETPYVGPRPFETGETLYGRDWEGEELRDLLIAKRIVLLHSPSGAGKTSLIQASLIPVLQEEGVRILPIVRVNAEPLSELVEAGRPLNRYVLSTLSYLENTRTEDDRREPTELAGVQLAEYLDQRRGEAAGKDPRQEPAVEMLVFDQFEEIVTVDPTDVEAKKEFFRQLGVALRDPSLYALFAMRGDYVGSLDPYLRPVPYLLSTRFRIERLGVEAARSAIREPARAWDVDFTGGAANKLIDDLRQVRVQRLDGTMQSSLGPHVEPVQLQVVCQLLWQRRHSEAAPITEADVGALGSVDAALGAYYAGEVARVAGKAGAPERAIRDWFDSQLITEQGFRGQIMQDVDQSGGLKNDAIRQLIDAYLVREEKRRGVTWFELAHDRLIEPVRQDNANWREANLQEWQRRGLLWNRQGQPATLLLAEKELKEAERWVERHPDEQLTEDERSFLDASRKAARLEAARRQRRLFLGGIALLILFTGLTAWALFSARQARIAKDNADQQRATAQAASTGALEQKKTAEAASTVAIEQEAIAQAASTKAIEQQKTAEAASTVAIKQGVTAISAKETAEAERISAIDARETLAANLEVILTAQVPTATPTPTASPTPTPTPCRTPSPHPTPAFTATPTITPTPTPNQAATATVEALQTQLAQVQATQTAVAVPPGPTTRLREKDGMVEVYVPTGEFQMGSTEGHYNEQPVHSVGLAGFWIDRTEVTNAQYAAFLNVQGNQTEGGATWLDIEDEDCLIEQSGEEFQPKNGYADHPVIEVSWYGAAAYCQWIAVRLPTEAEWEYAARGPEGHIYPWGDEFDCSRGNFDDESQLDDYVVPGGKGCDGYERTAPVGSFPDGASWRGVQDLAGNVWEWVADWDGNYPSGRQVNPTGPSSGQYRVLRGGSWDSGPDNGRSTNRNGNVPVHWGTNIGFRCARGSD